MHNAPSVSYPVGRSRWAGGLQGAAFGLGVAGIAGWAYQAQPTPSRVVGALCLALLAGALALRAWLRAPAGVLSWNGESWSWRDAAGAQAGEPRCVVDLQRWLLLRWESSGGVLWLWAERGRDPGHWDDLRRAVYSRARPGPPRGAAPEREATP
jgi:toxin CptA